MLHFLLICNILKIINVKQQANALECSSFNCCVVMYLINKHGSRYGEGNNIC